MICCGNNFNLRIAGVTLRFFTKESCNLAIEQFYEHFLIPDSIQPDVNVEVKFETGYDLNNKKEVFKAEYEYGFAAKKKYKWAVYQPGYTFASFGAETSQIPLIVCNPADEGRNWVIYTVLRRKILGNDYLEPLPYPVGPLIMYHYFTTHHAVMVHASGIYDPLTLKGFVFAAVSGTGKTTMSQLWEQKGCEVINDDRLILKMHDDKVMMHNNPLYMKDKPRSCEVKAIFLIHQAVQHEIKQLSGIHAYTGLMSYCIQHHYDKEMTIKMADTVGQIISMVPVYSLGFSLNIDIVDYVREKV